METRLTIIDFEFSMEQFEDFKEFMEGMYPKAKIYEVKQSDGTKRWGGNNG